MEPRNARNARITSFLKTGWPGDRFGGIFANPLSSQIAGGY